MPCPFSPLIGRGAQSLEVDAPWAIPSGRFRATVTVMRVDEMAAEQRAAYERDVLDSTERGMAQGQHGFDYEFHGASLIGAFPETQIEVRYWDPRYRRERRPRYRIWRDLVDSDGLLEYPAPRAGVLIKVWALGG
jgi:hypothetical protein